MDKTRTLRGWLAAAFALCLGLTGLVTPTTAQADDVITPVGTWLDTTHGRVQALAVSPAKPSYDVGDVVTIQYRLESNAAAPARTITTSSTTLADASSCNWANLPAGTAGRYTCAVRIPARQDPFVTYTVTAADAAAGRAVIDMTWTETQPGVAPVSTTIHSSLPVTPAATDYVNISVARTDSLGAQVSVGDTLTYTFSYTNTSDRTITVFPRTSNLSSMLPPNPPNCRWANLAAGQSATCTFASRTVTQADLTAGSFTPTATFDVTSDREGTDVLRAGIVVTAAPVAISGAQTPTRPEGEYVTLATAGYAGFTCHRIPALTQANNGWILAAWDGRPGGCADAPNPNSIVQRISTDGGQTWGEPKVIAAGQTAAPRFGYSDPSYIVDRETGDIFTFFLKSYDQGWWGSQAGTDPNDRNVIHASFIKSSDNGETWTAPQIITADITPNPAWTSRFASSGEGIQLRYGDYAGRLIQQYNVNNGGTVQAMSVYSDDHGATWQAGTPVGTSMDENKTVELSDGRVMLNSRAPGTGARKITISEDGGQTYGPVYVDGALIDPTNNASITRAYPNAPEGSAQAKMLLFSNAAAGSRSNGTVRISYDDGQTWSASKVFEPGSMSYSTLTPLAYGPNAQEGVYGLLFEGTGSTIQYMQVSLDWLGALPVTVATEAQTVNRGANTVTFEVTNVGPGNLTDLVLTPTAPSGWTAAPSAAFNLAAGATTTVTVTLTVPTSAASGTTILPVTVGNADGSVTGSARLVLDSAGYLAVSIARTDSVGSTVQVGDTLTYSISYTNVSDRSVTAFPRTSNLDRTLPPAAPNCRWVDLAPGQTGTCSSSTHTVTEADLAAGSFTARAVFDATTDRDGTNALQSGIVVTAAPVTVSNS